MTFDAPTPRPDEDEGEGDGDGVGGISVFCLELNVMRVRDGIQGFAFS